jgi:hypothetical protein
LRQGDQVVWVTTENGVTSVKMETSPLQAPQQRHGKSDFAAYVRDLVDDPAHDMSLALQNRPRPVQQAAIVAKPTVEATPIPARTTVTTHVAIPGGAREIVQRGPLLSFGESAVVVALVIGGLVALAAHATRSA